MKEIKKDKMTAKITNLKWFSYPAFILFIPVKVFKK
jgi:hypothetical protein